MSFTPQPHTLIFNDNHNARNQDQSFPHFSLLPKELRLKIWQHALERDRIIKVRIGAHPSVLELRLAEHSGRAPRPDIQILGSYGDSERHRVIVTAGQTMPTLLHVTRESRGESLRFYRVHIPCAFADPNGNEKGSGTLYFNPEHDFMLINPQWPVKDSLIDFLYHLKTKLDPRGVGLRRLAIDSNSLLGNDLSMLQPSDLPDEVRAAVTLVLEDLDEVFFVSTVRVGRQLLGWKSGIGSSAYLYNRSFPVQAIATTFDRRRDPRSIAPDLKRVYVGMGREGDMVILWHQLLAKFGIGTDNKHTEYRFLLTFDPTIDGDPIVDQKSAETWLMKESERWQNEAGELSINDDLRQDAKTTLGFWLFPIEVLEKAPSYEDGPVKMLDLSEYWPELASFDFM
ncbi:hypothetical protein CC78DRAFT_576629 [Lojkania enalia]|uniref:2EXR domain-containing protein n=1 Tax=Lojkania enalia TaxID=147567 RepID=A0A9P4N369_9PLEO|nr:hypothetical protein CC78DRAFT_576629 [Didymosphaeria enalia]